MTYIREVGAIYCLFHGCVHPESRSPYGYFEEDCRREEWRPVYWRTHVGDLEHQTRGEDSEA